jgi:hypothetical protein
VEDVKTQIQPELIDDLMETYLEWREECVGLADAYERWLSVPLAERSLPFAAYRAALDREEQASAVYADRVDRIERQLLAPRPRRPALDPGNFTGDLLAPS